MAKPIEPDDLKDGTRLVRRVLKAIPAELDDRDDAVLRKVVEGYSNAANLAARNAPKGEQTAE